MLNGNPQQYGVTTFDRDDLLCCNCASCARELVGPRHRQYAHLFGMEVATYLHRRPYCGQCHRSAAATRVICAECNHRVCAGEADLLGDQVFCFHCAQPRKPILFCGRGDRHQKMKHDNGVHGDLGAPLPNLVLAPTIASEG